MTSARAAVALLRTALAAAAQAVDLLEAAIDDQGDKLVSLEDGCDNIKGATLVRWARTGRLTAYEVARGKLVSWRGDIRAAIETNPYTPAVREVPAESESENDLLEDAIASGELRAGAK